MLRHGNTFAKSAHLGEDRIGRRRPRKGLGFGVVSVHEVVNLGHEVFHALEGPVANGLLGDPTEPEFHLVEPGRIGRGVMDMVAGARCQPQPHLRVFVRGIVLDNEMDCQLPRHIGLNVPQKRQEFLMPVAAVDID